MPSIELRRMQVKQVWEEQKYGVHLTFDKLSNVLVEEVTRQLGTKLQIEGRDLNYRYNAKVTVTPMVFTAIRQGSSSRKVVWM